MGGKRCARFLDFHAKFLACSMICCVLQATGWVSLYIVLRATVDMDVLGHTLGAICFAEALAFAMTGGLFCAEKEPALHWQDVLETILVRWVAGCVILLGSLIFGFLPLFSKEPLLLIGSLGIALCICILRLVFGCQQTVGGRLAFLPSCRWGILAILLFWAADLVEFDAGSLVGLSALILLLLTMAQARSVSRMIGSSPGQPHRALPDNILTLPAAVLPVLDILMLSYLLPSSAAALYLAVRVIAMVVEMCFQQLARKSRRSLFVAEAKGGYLAFRKLAARLNLGMLLIGGSVGMCVLSFAPYLAPIMNATMHEFHALLFWSVLARMTPALFGAAGLLLDIAGYRRDILVIRIICVVGLIVSAVISPPDSAVRLAQYLAIFHLCLSGALAGVLAWRTGIWPGLTALCFSQIRLF